MLSMPRSLHDEKRRNTYPSHIVNTWYHVCDSSELVGDKAIEVRVAHQTFVVWRSADGTPVCQSAFCLHLGANLGVGGKVVDGCVECPFHKWKFNKDGTINEIPYLTDPKQVPHNKALKTFPCVDWCGLVCMYFHADGHDPEFHLPAFATEELKSGNWVQHLKWDIGFQTLSPVDLVDQAGDHSHFHTLHNEFKIPWTNLPILQWLMKLIPLGIRHRPTTFRGDDADFVEFMKESGYGAVDKYLIYFRDIAGLTWKNKLMESTVSETIEVYVGPSLVILNIPFTIGAMKIFLSTTPVEGGSIMKARTWIDRRAQLNPFCRLIA